MKKKENKVKHSNRADALTFINLLQSNAVGRVGEVFIEKHEFGAHRIYQQVQRDLQCPSTVSKF